jgi:hypothetical protein
MSNKPVNQGGLKRALPEGRVIPEGGVRRQAPERRAIPGWTPWVPNSSSFPMIERSSSIVASPEISIAKVSLLALTSSHRSFRASENGVSEKKSYSNAARNFRD